MTARPDDILAGDGHPPWAVHPADAGPQQFGPSSLYNGDLEYGTRNPFSLWSNPTADMSPLETLFGPLDELSMHSEFIQDHRYLPNVALGALASDGPNLNYSPAAPHALLPVPPRPYASLPHTPLDQDFSLPFIQHDNLDSLTGPDELSSLKHELSPPEVMTASTLFQTEPDHYTLCSFPASDQHPGPRRMKQYLTVDTTGSFSQRQSSASPTASVAGPSCPAITEPQNTPNNMIPSSEMAPYDAQLQFAPIPQGFSNGRFDHHRFGSTQGDFKNFSVPIHDLGVSTELRVTIPLPNAGSAPYRTAPPVVTQPHRPFFDWSAAPVNTRHARYQAHSPLSSLAGGLFADFSQPQHELTGPSRSPLRSRPHHEPYPSTPHHVRGPMPLGAVDDDTADPEYLRVELIRWAHELQQPNALNSEEDENRLKACLKKHSETIANLGHPEPHINFETMNGNQLRGQKARRKPKKLEDLKICFVCGQTLTTRQNLRKHLDSHFGIKRVKCSECDAILSGDLPRHMRKCHLGCNTCGAFRVGGTVDHQPNCPDGQ